MGLEFVTKKFSKTPPLALVNWLHPDGNTACVTYADVDAAPAALMASAHL